MFETGKSRHKESVYAGMSTNDYSQSSAGTPTTWATSSATSGVRVVATVGECLDLCPTHGTS